jgi:hypothetical protein
MDDRGGGGAMNEREALSAARFLASRVRMLLQTELGTLTSADLEILRIALDRFEAKAAEEAPTQ